jgi:hypothetical protein
LKQVNLDEVAIIRDRFELPTEEEIVIDFTELEAEEVAAKIARWVW